MSDTLTTLKELAAQVRGATRKGENTAERVGRLFVGILPSWKNPKFHSSLPRDTIRLGH